MQTQKKKNPNQCMPNLVELIVGESSRTDIMGWTRGQKRKFSRLHGDGNRTNNLGVRLASLFRDALRASLA
jgi:hypothetical protein